jgi:rfaE bifunctional protein nucleotidyltransferase chain/domain
MRRAKSWAPAVGESNGVSRRARLWICFLIAVERLFRHNHLVNFRDKIIPWEKLPEWRAAMRSSGKKLVVTNGCFDLLHLGHVTYLETARRNGDALLIGVNRDDSVRQLKGPDRPLNVEQDRAAVLAALESVAGVCIFAEKTATRFLSAAQPDVYVKGGDYTLETLDKDEREAVEKAGGKIVIIPFVPGKSTTDLLKKISRL